MVDSTWLNQGKWCLKKTQQRNGDWNNNYGAFEQQPWLNSMFSPAKLVGFILFSQLKYYEENRVLSSKDGYLIIASHVGMWVWPTKIWVMRIIGISCRQVKEFSQCWCYNRMGTAKICCVLPPIEPISSKTWCRASERRATVVTLPTFYMGELKRLKNETLVSEAKSSSSSSPSTLSIIIIIIILTIITNIIIVKRTYSSIAWRMCGHEWSARERTLMLHNARVEVQESVE